MGFNAAGMSTLPLEMAETMNGSWGFSLTDDTYKSTEQLVRTMVGAAGRDANFLLNTGPMPNGKIQPENLKTFQEIGDWLKVHGASISIRGAARFRLSHGASPPLDMTARSISTCSIGNRAGCSFRCPAASPVQISWQTAAALPFRMRADGIELDLSERRKDEWDRVIALHP